MSEKDLERNLPDSGTAEDQIERQPDEGEDDADFEGHRHLIERHLGEAPEKHEDV